VKFTKFANRKPLTVDGCGRRETTEAFAQDLASGGQVMSDLMEDRHPIRESSLVKFVLAMSQESQIFDWESTMESCALLLA
jgi:hypothetical protein